MLKDEIRAKIKFLRQRINYEKNPLAQINLRRELGKLESQLKNKNDNDNKINDSCIAMPNLVSSNISDISSMSSDIFSFYSSEKTITQPPKIEEEPKKIPKPKEIKEFLDQYVIGQEDAKKALSVAVHNHYIRINNKSDDDIEIQKSNILLIGNSGSGKTLLAQTIAKFLDVPFISVDATQLTPTGIVGKDVESVVDDLLKAAHGDVKKAANGIIYIDEIDKTANNGIMTREAHNVKGVLGGETQAALLKLLEGNELNTSVNGNSLFNRGSSEKVNIKNVLFICGGAFAGIEEYTWGNDDHKQIGFLSTNQTKDNKNNKGLEDVGTEEIIKYGMMPEIIGRLPVLIKLKQLNKDDLVQILTQPKNALIKQYKKLLLIDGVELNFSDDALELIAEMSIIKKTGARGLRSIVEQIMTNIIFELPDDIYIRQCYITADHIKKNLIPELIKVAN